MVFAWKMMPCRYSIWIPYIFLVAIESSVEFSFFFSHVFYFTFGAFQQVNDILILQFKLWQIWNIRLVWLLLNVVECTICLQHRVLLLAKHGVYLTCILFVNILLTLSFLINLVPIMSLRFLFQQKTKIGEIRNILAIYIYIMAWVCFWCNP